MYKEMTIKYVIVLPKLYHITVNPLGGGGGIISKDNESVKWEIQSRKSNIKLSCNKITNMMCQHKRLQ